MSAALTDRIRAASIAHGVDYDMGGGKRIAIPVMTQPLTVDARALRALHGISEAINRHVRRLPAAWFRDPRVASVVFFPDAERAFLEDVWRDEHAGAQTIVSRNDLDAPSDTRRTVAFETNGCAIGGVVYGAATARVLEDVVLGTRGDRDRFTPIPDGRHVQLELLRDHARLLGLPARFRVGILENREWDAGITEMPRVAAFLEAYGHPVVLGDPRDLTVGRGGFRLGGLPVDLLYRNMELADFVAIESESGRTLRAVREAFRANAVVSGIAGDFDQKSVWELLTARHFDQHVAKDDRALLRRHLLWTRLFRDTETEGPDGARGLDAPAGS